MLRQCHVSDCSIKKNHATYATGRAHGVDGIAARVGEIVAAHALGVLHGRLITLCGSEVRVSPREILGHAQPRPLTRSGLLCGGVGLIRVPGRAGSPQPPRILPRMTLAPLTKFFLRWSLLSGDSAPQSGELPRPWLTRAQGTVSKGLQRP